MAIKDIAGNGLAKTSLLSYVKSPKTGTSYIFAGEENTGKKYSAIQFAKALNCENPMPDSDCCDGCSSCKLLDRVFTELDEDGMQLNPHPDVLYINTEKANIVIDMVLDKLQEINAYRAIKLKKKIVIMNDAEKMNNVASNAILKELEEPNENAAIILIVNNQEKLLPTIISRCHRVEIKRAPVQEIRAKLKIIKPELTGEKLEEAVLFCEGKIGDAFDYEGIKEKVAAAAGIARAISGKTDNIEGIFLKVQELETAKKAKKEDKDGNTRVFFLDILKILSYIYKDLLLAKAGVKDVMKQKYSINSSEIRELSEKKIVNIIGLIESAQRDLMANANTGLLFSGLFFGIRKEGLRND
ncbi:MAG: hypothetical protein CVV21_06950 [Candidatus Goldiibacteriota bacterium HGW-Goldbacteria-1]|jgi:DNA polymerase-3 subunit delta'|nr:MAG: hypothetical protein CVV21_06950 [Candidatus Goldiibacteriota bacterium HGW-Goldbacteria-1]